MSSDLPQVDELGGCADMVTKAGTKFKFAQQKLMLTYKTHIDKNAFKEFIEKLIHHETKICRVAHENGAANDLCPYEHSHALLDFGTRYQTTNPRAFDFLGIHPHIKKITSKVGWTNAQNYISKEDPECSDLKLVSTTIQLTNIVASKTAWDAVLNNASFKPDGNIDIRRALDVKLFYEQMHVDEDEHDIIELNHQWQRDLAQELEGVANKRKVIWIYDPIGNTGKTDLTLYLNDLDKTKYLGTDSLGKVADASHVIKEALASGWNGHCILIDLGRNCEDHCSVYQYIENLKNGRITSTKYTGGIKRFRRGHVVVMANFLPMPDKLSLDRWDCREITISMQMCPISVYGGPRLDIEPQQRLAIKEQEVMLLQIKLEEAIGAVNELKKLLA